MNPTIIIVPLAIVFGGGLIILAIVLITKFISPRKVATLRKLYKAGNYRGAIKIAKEILSKSPNNMEAHFYLGECYITQGKDELALVEFKSSAKSGVFTADVKENRVRERLAELFFKFEQFEDALKEYLLLIKNYPNEMMYFFKIGELLEKKNNREKAAKFYMQAIKMKGNYAPALKNLGRILYQSKKYADAEKILGKAERLEPDDFETALYIGMIYKERNDYKKALKYFDKASRDKDQKVRAFTEKALVYMIMEKYSEAALELEKVINNLEEENNRKLNIRYLLASTLENQRKITEAISQWEKIYSVNPKFKDVSEKLANYQDLRMDDKMKDFLTATNEVFFDICKRIINGMGLDVRETIPLQQDGIGFLAIENDNKWRNVIKRPKIVHIYRCSKPIDEATVRRMHETMKKDGIMRGIIMSSSSFTSLAHTFVQERPITLMDKDGIEEILTNIN